MRVTTIAEPLYGPLVEVCRRYGISRTRAFALARSGMLETFKLGARTMVYLESVRTLPQRLKQSATARDTSAQVIAASRRPERRRDRSSDRRKLH